MHVSLTMFIILTPNLLVSGDKRKANIKKDGGAAAEQQGPGAADGQGGGGAGAGPEPSNCPLPHQYNYQGLTE